MATRDEATESEVVSDVEVDVATTSRVALFLSSRANRARLFGARIEVCGFLVARQPTPALLIVKSQWGPWMPCQEGVRVGESFEEAFRRGLTEELGITWEDEANQPFLDDRGQRYLGTRKLALDRPDRGVRSVAPGLPDSHPLSRVKMRKKAYWGVYRQIVSRDVLDPTPNGTEVVDVDWVSLAEARTRFAATMTPGKARLIGKGIDLCERIVAGADLQPPQLDAPA